jgi:tetratricopeptide (TPR) repeat protein
MQKKTGFILFSLIIISTAFTKSYGQFDVVSSTVERSADSVWAYPAYLTGYDQTVSAQKILNIPTAEKQWEAVRKQNNRAAEALALLDLSDAYIAFGKEQQAYNYLTNLLQLKSYLYSENAVSHLYYNLAVILAHLKLYPLAMEAFSNTNNIIPDFGLKRKRRKFKLIDSSFHFSRSAELVNSNESEELMSTKELDDALLSIDTAKIQDLLRNEESPPVVLDSVLVNFEDGKKASNYAVIVHIKQPITGKKKLVAHYTNVGHMFITLIKYNDDETVVSRSFGLYPESGFLFSATPLFPKTEPLFKNDAKHNWDELLGKFISKDQFDKILDYIDQTADNAYHLNSNNCSDFALTIAKFAGIEIADTKGNWVIGSGNSPACAGQSVLAAKYKNYETNSREGILACTNNLFLRSR